MNSDSKRLLGDSKVLVRCETCLRELTLGTCFCTRCGTAVGATKPSLEAFLLLTLTTLWAIASLALSTAPMTNLWLVALPFALILPCLVLSPAVIQLAYRGSGFAAVPVPPRIILAISAIWFVFCVYLSSEPLPDLAGLLSAIGFWLALVASWAIVLAPASYRIWKAFGTRRMWRIIGYLAPLPVATAAIIVLDDQEVPMRFRLEASEPALTEIVEGDHGTGRAGLFVVEDLYSAQGCQVLQTGRFLGQRAGIAYCEDKPKSGNAEFDHLTGPWWEYRYTEPYED